MFSLRRAMTALLAATLAFGAVACSGPNPGADLVEYPSGCIRIHPDVAFESHTRWSHEGWAWFPGRREWRVLPQDIFVGSAMSVNEAIWQAPDTQNHLACAGSNGGRQ